MGVVSSLFLRVVHRLSVGPVGLTKLCHDDLAERIGMASLNLMLMLARLLDVSIGLHVDQRIDADAEHIVS